MVGSEEGSSKYSEDRNYKPCGGNNPCRGLVESLSAQDLLGIHAFKAGLPETGGQRDRKSAVPGSKSLINKRCSDEYCLWCVSPLAEKREFLTNFGRCNANLGSFVEGILKVVLAHSQQPSFFPCQLSPCPQQPHL